MNVNEFIKVVSTFADNPSNVTYSKGTFLAEIRNNIISGKLRECDGTLYVKEDDIELEARQWIKERIAALPILAKCILEYIPKTNDFVDPSGQWDDGEQFISVESCTETLSKNIKSDVPNTTQITYLTSDAGEGKTTIINELARKQAAKFKEGTSNWLLIPIPLGGRPFLRFDDITIASLVNTLRFRYFYYDSFIELIKLGLIIPAFDGFEEMFMQNSSGEALTATGELINMLDSKGSILIAARKAYFDYKSFKTQAKLYDSIHESVIFSKLAINRWEKSQFIEYAYLRKIKDVEKLYDKLVCGLNNPNHALLTRPVLSKKLLDIVETSSDLSSLFEKLSTAANYFPIFINSIIEREANEKWIDRSGEPFKPLISIPEHYNLLSLIAEEMWQNNTDALQESIIDFLAEIFCEQSDFNNHISRQVKERLKQHALIIKPSATNPIYKFDHEEFYHYFLGVSIANHIQKEHINNVKNILRKGSIPESIITSVVLYLKANYKGDIKNIIDVLEQCMRGENKYSYIKENAGYIIIKLLSKYESSIDIILSEYAFPSDALSGLMLSKIVFSQCYIQSTSLQNTQLTDCKFIGCQIDNLEIDDETTNIINTSLETCNISSIYNLSNDKGFYDNNTINQILRQKGFIFIDQIQQNTGDVFEYDEDLELTEKALRRFIRSNSPINDTIFLMRLGAKGDYFIKNILKDLIACNIVKEVPYTGSGQKRRYKLNVQFSDIESAFSQCNGAYQNFLDYFRYRN